MKKSAIIVAGGTGTRMNAAVPKQFLLLAGKPVIMHSMTAFSKASPGVTLVLVLPGNEFSAWRKLCDQYKFSIPHHLTKGGETRFHSVKNALSELDNDGLVAIHDGARPLVSETLIKQAFQSAELMGNCIPVIPVSESLRRLDGESNNPVDRTKYRIIQTPQVFHAALIKKAYAQPYREQFTDDATVAESLGETIHLIPGDPVNLKITYPHDLVLAGYLMEKS